MKTDFFRKRGVKFLIPRNEELDAKLYEASKEFLDLCNFAIKNHYELIKQLVDKYGSENVTLSNFCILVKTDQVAFIGTDGQQYQFAQKVQNRKKGNQSWFILADQLASDIVDQTQGKITDTVMSKMVANRLKMNCSDIVKEVSQLAITRLSSRKRQKSKNQTTIDVIVDKDNPPVFRSHTLYSSKGLFEVTDSMIVWNGLTRIEIPFSQIVPCKRDDYSIEDFIGKRKGGYLTIHQTQPMLNKHGKRIKTRKSKKHHVFVMTTEVPIENFKLAFDMRGWFAFDINMTKKYWLTCYDSLNDKNIVIHLPEKFGEIINIRKDHNEALQNTDKAKRRENGLRSNHSRYIRLDLQKLNALQKRQITDFFRNQIIDELEGLSILQYCSKYKLGLAIDAIQPGKGTGSFYQDAICMAIPVLCEQNGIPYDLVDPKYTSRTCSKCGNLHSATDMKRMKKDDEFTCKSCGFTGLSLHENAARNIAKKASYYVGVEKKVD